MPNVHWRKTKGSPPPPYVTAAPILFTQLWATVDLDLDLDLVKGVTLQGRHHEGDY